jgi:hypothetical protein
VILERSRSLVILRVGNVVVLHRPKAEPENPPSPGTATTVAPEP